jgi:hypothetical protein
MRRLDETPLDPEVAASLDAIDATLAGDPVDPAYAELAELALLLAAERPQPSPAFSQALDERVAQRFSAARPSAGKARRVGRWWLWTPAVGLAALLLVAVVIVLGGGSRPVRTTAGAAGSAAAPGIPRRTSSASGSAGAAQPPNPGRLSASSAAGTTTTASPAPFGVDAAAGTPPQPPANGRKTIQGAQLWLTTSPSRIEDVAQQVFAVVGQVHGTVNSSMVSATRGAGGYAQFQLRIPSSSMPQAMAALSSLRYARVATRTDTTQDVNDQYQADVRRLADDRTLRASLLKQLADAVTQGQIDSVRARIHDAESAIANDQAALRSLGSQVAYSQVAVTINAGTVRMAVPSVGGGGFTFHRALHDAGRVLTVAAGVAVICLAALVPFALLAGLAWWIGTALRRRRREQALDLV